MTKKKLILRKLWEHFLEKESFCKNTSNNNATSVDSELIRKKSETKENNKITD